MTCQMYCSGTFAAEGSWAEAFCICSISYGPEVPEWKMEKHRFYCELPGDIWEDGYFMQLVRIQAIIAWGLSDDCACKQASRAALCGCPPQHMSISAEDPRHGHSKHSCSGYKHRVACMCAALVRLWAVPLETLHEGADPACILTATGEDGTAVQG
jgi:hypothetical protein